MNIAIAGGIPYTPLSDTARNIRLLVAEIPLYIPPDNIPINTRLYPTNISLYAEQIQLIPAQKI